MPILVVGSVAYEKVAEACMRRRQAASAGTHKQEASVQGDGLTESMTGKAGTAQTLDRRQFSDGILQVEKARKM